MTEPTTAAGRALLERLGDLPKLMPYDDEARDQILAIEAEARQQDASALRGALERLLRFTHALTAADHEAPLRAGANLDDLHAAEAALAALPPSAPECSDPEHPNGAYCRNTTGLLACYVPPSTPAGLDPEQLADAIGPEDLEWWADEIRHDSDPAEVRIRLARSIIARLEQDHP